jgi:hypothetical protein
MIVDRLRDALATSRPVWVEIWNGEVIWDIYTPGKLLVAGEDPHHRLMLDPVPGDPVVHNKAAGARGEFNALSTVAENRGLIRIKQHGRKSKAYCILLKDDVHFEVPLQPFKDQFKTQILASKNNALHYPSRRIYLSLSAGI